MNKKILLPVFGAMMTATAAEIAPKPMPAKVVGQQQEESYSLKLLNTTKRARSKLQLKQNASAELKTIISTKKTIETMRLKAAADFAGQQATLTSRNADSATLEALIRKCKIPQCRKFMKELIGLWNVCFDNEESTP
jgi:hypothetical protein